jgi:hypothetical protein
MKPSVAHAGTTGIAGGYQVFKDPGDDAPCEASTEAAGTVKKWFYLR